MAAGVEPRLSQDPKASLSAELRQLGKLAGPLAIAQAGQSLMGLVDAAVVGRAGAAPLAGTALGSSIFFTLSILGLGLALGLDPLISQAIGAGQPVRARRLFWQGVWLALAGTVVILPPMALMPLLLRPFGISEELAQQTTSFLWWRMPSILPLLVFAAGRAYLQAVHRPQVLAWSTVAANVVNLGLDVLFVFGGESLPAWTGLRWVPAMSAAGAALASTLCTLFQMAIICVAVRRAPLPERPADLWRPLRGDLMQATRIGVPVGLHLGAEVGVFALAGFLAGKLGTEEVAAHQVALMLCSLAFSVSVGFGNAGAVRVGVAVGARDTPRARLAGFAAFGCGLAVMSVSALVFVLFPEALAALMTDQVPVQRLVIPLLLVAAVFQLSDGIQGVGAGVLRGAGESRFTFVANMLGHYLIGLPLSLYLGLKLGLGVTGIWWGLCAGLTFVAVCLFGRFWRLSAREIVPVAQRG
jgi:MATE family multidrug resistance protein